MSHLKLLTGLCLASAYIGASAAGIPPNLFVQALTQGSADMVLPDNKQLAPQIAALKKLTQNDGPISIHAQRVKRFTQQRNCGRVLFLPFQASSKVAWPQLGGQLNVCEDGLPPWQICGQDQHLVPPGSKCKDGSLAHNTPEVEEAIKEAISAGSLDPAEAMKLFSAPHAASQPQAAEGPK